MTEFIELIRAGVGDWWIAIVSALPIVELRAAIPMAAAYGVPWWEALTLSFIGNMLPVPFIILLGRRIIDGMKKMKFIAPFSYKLEQRTLKHRDKIVKYSMLGLFVLVAIPLPGTGAWTGALLAALVDLRLKNALPAIAAGVVAAGIIVAVVSYGVASAVGA